MLRSSRRVGSCLTLPAVLGMLVPADAQAFFGLFHRQQKQNAAAALYGGTVCNPCGQQLVVNYVPQTCYRAQTVTVPVTTYHPIVSCDPCSGCQTTCMKPTTCFRQQVQYTPYQSFRLQYSVAQPSCPTTATTYYAPAATTAVIPTTTYAAPTTGCSTCNGATTAAFTAPSLSYAAPAAATVPATTAYTYPSSVGTTYQYAGPSVANAGGTATLSAPTGSSVVVTQPTPTIVASPISPPISSPTIVSPSSPSATVTVAPAQPTVVSDGGALAPVPTFAQPTADPISGTGTSSQTLRVPLPENRTPYSSGVTPEPATVPSTVPSPTPSSTVPILPQQPIPVEQQPTGPHFPMSAPRLVDPEDKTAGTSPVGRQASFSTAVDPQVASRPIVAASHAVNASAAIELGAPRPTAGYGQPTSWNTAKPVVDADGWRASSR